MPPSAALYAGSSLTTRDRYANLKTRLWTDRSSFDADWLEVGSFLMPRRSRFWPTDKNRGGRRNQQIIDSTARFSARTLASGMHSGMTSPARPWMKLSTPDPDLARFGPVKRWLHDVTERMFAVFEATNLYNVLPMSYMDMGIFGTAAMSMLDDSDDLFRCYSYPIGSYAFALNARGLPDTFVRKYQMSVGQIVEQFGTAPGYREIDWSHISRAVKNLWDSGDHESQIDVCWVVTPNYDYRPDSPLSKHMPFSSCTFEVGNAEPGKGFLRESGFRTFPLMCPRWDVTGEDTYATDCPGFTAIGDIKGLQIMKRKEALAIAKTIDPPLKAPPSVRNQKVSLLGADITYVAPNEASGLTPLHEFRIDLSHLTASIQDVRYMIQRAFYEDLFSSMARMDEQRGAQPPTAREIDERHEEKLIVLGPVLERTEDELLELVINRAYGMMERVGAGTDDPMIPEPPPELHGVKLKVEYTSILAQAQKLVGVVGLDRFMSTQANLVQFFPAVRHKVDAFRVVDNYGEMLGVDPNIVIDTEQAKQSAAEEAQQQQQAAQAEQAAKMGAGIAAAGAKPIAGDSALDRILQGLGGAPGGPAGVAGVGA